MLHNPYKIVRMFEEEIAAYTGAPYAISVDSCTNALFLICHYNKVKEVTEGGAKKHFKNVKAVAHFLRDSDILPNQKFAPSEWTVHGGIKFKSQTQGRK